MEETTTNSNVDVDVDVTADRDLVREIDEQFKILYASPSEKTVQTAHRLEELFREWRNACIEATLNNMVHVTDELMKNLRVMGCRFCKEATP